MTTLVVGATGGTGRTVVKHLLDRGQAVKAIVRSKDKLPPATRDDPRLDVVEAPILDLSDADLDRQVSDCSTVVSCLGHTMSFRGLFLPPRRLVTESVCRLCSSIRRAQGAARAVKFVLMSSVAIVDSTVDKALPAGDRLVLGALRLFLPPHADNVDAAAFLWSEIGGDDPALEWVAVRPTGLIDAEELSEYRVVSSPLSGPISGDGTASRINVGHFMADLVTNNALWEKWKGRMPVIYNREEDSAERPSEDR